VASGSVIGSGLGRRGSSVRWGTAGRIAVGWLLTLPAAAVVGAVAALLADIGPIGVLIDIVVGAAIVVYIFWRAGRNRVSSENAVHPLPVQGKSEVAASAKVVKIKKVKPLKKQRPRRESA
jgi:PiT family inorganic phosphate transporter